MDDALGVRAHSAAPKAEAISSNRSSGIPPRGGARERLALDELHRHEVNVVDDLDRVDRDDVGMVEGGDGLGLALSGQPAAGPAIRAAGT